MTTVTWKSIHCHWLSGKCRSKQCNITSYLWKLPIWKRPETISADKDVVKKVTLILVLLCTSTTLEDGVETSQIIIIRISISSSNFAFNIYSKNTKTLIQKNCTMFITTLQDLEATQMPNNRRADKEIVVYIHIGILSKKSWNFAVDVIWVKQKGVLSHVRQKVNYSNILLKYVVYLLKYGV